MHAECHWLPDYKEGKGAERSAQANCPRPILSRRIDWLPVLECGDHAHEHAIAAEHRLAAIIHSESYLTLFIIQIVDSGYILFATCNRWPAHAIPRLAFLFLQFHLS
jgi:hypothetical protein